MVWHNQRTVLISCCLALIVWLPGVGHSQNSREKTVDVSTVTENNLLLPELVEQMAGYGFTEQQRHQFREMVERARRLGLPEAPLGEKVREGMAKGYDSQMIIGAARQVANRYEVSYGQVGTLALDEGNRNRLGDTLAQAYAAGLRENDMTPVMARLRQHQTSMTPVQRYELATQVMLAARETARRQVRSATIGQMLSAALRNSYGAMEIEALRLRFEAQTRHGSPQELAEQMVGELARSANGQQGGAAAGNISGGTTQGQAGQGGGQMGSGAASSGSVGPGTETNPGSSGAGQQSGGGAGSGGSGSGGSGNGGGGQR